MFSRFLSVGIVLFWLTMTGLLLRGEWFPDAANRVAVPPEHVFKQLFLHEQSSDLTLYRQRQRLGSFHVLPRRIPAGDRSGAVHSLNISGGSSLEFFGLPNQRAILRVVFDYDDQQTLVRFDFSATIRDPKVKEPSLGIIFDGTPPTDRFHYVIRRGEVVEKEAAGSREQLLDDPELQSLGFDPRPIFRQLLTQAAGQTHVEAHRSSLPLNGETVETYVVTVRQGSAEAAALQTTQQGQILSLVTFTGYDLYDDAITP